MPFHAAGVGRNPGHRKESAVADNQPEPDNSPSATPEHRNSLAAQYGYEGESAEVFARYLQGETEQEVATDAVHLHSLLNPPAKAVDPSQGRQSPAPVNHGKVWGERVADQLIMSKLNRRGRWGNDPFASMSIDPTGEYR